MAWLAHSNSLPSDAKVQFQTDARTKNRKNRTVVQVQFSLVHEFWTVSSVLGSMIFENLRTGFEPVRTELSVHIFF